MPWQLLACCGGRSCRLLQASWAVCANQGIVTNCAHGLLLQANALSSQRIVVKLLMGYCLLHITLDRHVFGNAVVETHGFGGRSREIAQGAAAYMQQLLLARQQQRKEQRRLERAAAAGGQQGAAAAVAAAAAAVLPLQPMSMPVGMHICTKITWRYALYWLADRHLPPSTTC